jgi:glycosyltransferase involved in cell wall biosynthesis
MRLSIVVPAYNEEKRIGPMLDAYLPFFTARYGADFECMVVINGSRDGTEGVVRAYQSQFPALRVIVDPNKLGKGGSLIKGFHAARGDIVGFCDADGATPPEAWQALVEDLPGADCVIASRWRRGSVVSPRQSLLRRLTSRIFNLTTRLLFGLRLTDTQCGAKVMRREALLKALPSLGVTQWAFDVDLLLQLKRTGGLIREIPTTWHDVEGSKVEIVRTSAEMFAALVRLRLLHSPLHGVVRIYDDYLGPFVHPPKLENDRLFRHSLLVMLGVQGASIFNVLFQIAMAWMLSNRDYGVLAAMTGFCALAAAPLGSFGRAASHYTEEFLKEGASGKVHGVIRRLLRDVSILVLVILLATVVGGGGALMRFYQLDSLAPALLAVAAVVVGVYAGITDGVFGGAQAFIWIFGVGIIASATRLFAGGSLAALGLGAPGALAGVLLSNILCIGVAVVGIRQLLGAASGSPDRTAGLYSHFVKYAVAASALAVLVIGDVSIVKHFFGPEDAGLFAKAAMVARVVIFLPAPLATVFLPKMVSAESIGRGNARSLAKALVLTVVMVGSGALVCTLFPAFLLRVLACTEAPEAIPLLRGMVWALSPVSLLQVVMNFELAQRRFAVGGVLLAGALAYAGLCFFWHGSMAQVPLILGACGAATLAIAVARLPWAALRRQSAA